MPSVNQIPFTEKYRPETLDDVVGNDDSVNKLKKWLDDDSVPHVILQGPAGTGKTASIVAFAKEKFGDDWRSNLIQMNASDDRGIDVVRNDIKRHAQQSPSGQYQYKIIHLDESDSMTKDGMNALRRIMEKYSDQTRFFLSCNYSSKIIDPILSRCVNLPFNRLDDSEIRSILTNIAQKEDVTWESEAFDEIIDYVQGDARRAVHTLQMSIDDGEISKETLDFVNLQASKEDISEMVEFAINGEIENAIDMNMRDVQPQITDYGRFCQDLLSVLQSSDTIQDDVRFYAISQIGELERNILEGANPEVQINSFLAKLPVIQFSSIPSYE
jgi:replication factor C small subunit